jgi:hypothetical protein
MTNRFLIGLLAMALCFVIALPAYAQGPPKTEEKGRHPRIVVRTPPPAQAPLTPEKTALIKELMKLLNASTDTAALADTFLEQGLKQTAPLITQGLLQEIPQENLSPDARRRLKSEADEATQRILARIRAEIPKRVNFAELLERAGMEMYGKHFTENELKELIDMYKSPSVQKLLRLLPQITADTMPKITQWVTPIVTQLMDEVFIEEKKKFQTR